MPQPVAFTSIVGQTAMKRALVLNAINPGIGGVLIRGEKGTAKSTAVRGLVALLPDVEVVADCPFGCDPDDVPRLCDLCATRVAAGETLPRALRTMRVVELPINASEDRVVGSIDMESAIQRGERRFAPGVLASANRNILYVDEVNLLDDHIIDVLLDAAAMGRNTVEREGISVSHPARLILVGTMNPEEGELRPQLLDRFGLCIDVTGLATVAERVAVMDLDRGPGDAAALEASEDHLRSVIAEAREFLPLVTVPAPIRELVALICVDAGALGHRADIVVMQTARAICAWREALLVLEGRPDPNLTVSPEDVIEAATLALPHRARARSGVAEESEAVGERARQRAEEMQAGQPQESESVAGTEESTPESGEESGSTSVSEVAATQSSGTAEPGEAGGTAELAGDVFAVRKIALPRERAARHQSGKRSQSRSGDRRGRYVGSTQAEKTTDVAFDATLRAAAPHQRERIARDPGAARPALRLEKHDLRQKVRRRRTGTLIVFVVDASASMDAEQRMQATKGAILSLLRDAYVRRDKVALVVFSGRAARVVLQPTSSIDLAESRLQRLAVGGTTPLTHGLLAGLKLIRTERLRDPEVLPLLVLISDGRGNISLFGEEPLTEAQRVATQIGAEHIRMLTIDSARDHSNAAALPRVAALSPPGGAPYTAGYGFNACLDLAERSGGEYLGLYDLSQGAIVAGISRSLRQPRSA